LYFGIRRLSTGGAAVGCRRAALPFRPALPPAARSRPAVPPVAASRPAVPPVAGPRLAVPRPDRWPRAPAVPVWAPRPVVAAAGGTPTDGPGELVAAPADPVPAGTVGYAPLCCPLARDPGGGTVGYAPLCWPLLGRAAVVCPGGGTVG